MKYRATVFADLDYKAVYPLDVVYFRSYRAALDWVDAEFSGCDYYIQIDERNKSGKWDPFSELHP